MTAHGYEGPLQSSGAREGHSPERPRGISHTLDPGEPSAAQARGGVVFVANPARVELSRHPGACIGSHARACGSAVPFPRERCTTGQPSDSASPRRFSRKSKPRRTGWPGRHVPPDGPVGRLRLCASLISIKFLVFRQEQNMNKCALPVDARVKPGHDEFLDRATRGSRND